MSNYCGECAHLETDGACKWGDEYYCEETCKYTSIKKTACSRFIPKPDKGYKRAGCFITTMVCTILGLEDNCEVLESLRDLRENYLKQNSKGIEILMRYDQVGPVISGYIYNENPLYIKVIYDNILVPCAKMVQNKNYEVATTLYLSMIDILEARYNLRDRVIDKTIDTPIEILGKCRIR